MDQSPHQHGVVYQFGRVVVNDQSMVQRLTAEHMGGMKLYYEGVSAQKSDQIAPNDSAQIMRMEPATEDGEAGAKFRLALMNEEALFLMLHDVINSVFDPSSSTLLSADDLYVKFVRSQPRFPLMYRCYAYFKERQFVIKTGINFGMDYVLYRAGPDKVHSEMCIRVIDAVSPVPIQAHPTEVSLQTAYRNSQTKYTLNQGAQRAKHSSNSSSASAIAVEESISWRSLTTATRVMPVRSILVHVHALITQICKHYNPTTFHRLKIARFLSLTIT